MLIFPADEITVKIRASKGKESFLERVSWNYLGKSKVF